MSLPIPHEILNVWQRFDSFPMETLTKAWTFKNCNQVTQRTVEQMVAHRAKTGASGNCFDLALWLLTEFQKAGVPAYGIGNELGSSDAHVGVIALSANGARYLCDLGDLWIRPLLIDLDHESTPHTLHRGFFAGAEVCAKVLGNLLEVEYHRPNGKVSRQEYSLVKLSLDDLNAAGNVLQNHFEKPLVEMRLWHESECVHWEFENFSSFTSSHLGLHREKPADSLSEWAKRIADRTGMNANYVKECLEIYQAICEKIK